MTPAARRQQLRRRRRYLQAIFRLRHLADCAGRLAQSASAAGEALERMHYALAAVRARAILAIAPSSNEAAAIRMLDAIRRGLTK